MSVGLRLNPELMNDQLLDFLLDIALCQPCDLKVLITSASFLFLFAYRFCVIYDSIHKLSLDTVSEDDVGSFVSPLYFCIYIYI